MPTMRLVLALAATCSVALAGEAGDLPRQADESVAGIFLDDADSVRKVLGDVPFPGDHPSRASAPDLSLRVCNAARTELLILVFHPGGVRHENSQFEVRRLSQPPKGCVLAPAGIRTFVTGKGIRLGMTRKEVVGISGRASPSRRTDRRPPSATRWTTSTARRS